jgi:hypothetical protein
MGRERHEDDRPAARYVSRELPGYEDLDDYGDWRPSGYGMVWAPGVDAGWAPYIERVIWRCTVRFHS